jgi:TonB-linked SusC/RagA family outer membrane protein
MMCLAAAALSALVAPEASGQQATPAGSGGSVVGVVTDATSRSPLSGVTIEIEGTRLGSGSGADGRFRVAGVPAGSQVVIARRIGYNPSRQTVTVTAGAEVTANFVLGASPIALDQVVITGTAGATSRREIGNAVTSVSAVDELEKSAAPDMASLLNARAPGVTITPRTGRLGAGPSIQIRGRNSLGLDASPLIYVDGVRVSNATSTGPSTAGGLSGQASQVGGRLNDINPEDIESIEIIKGPAAATLYGTEASNGVIQIITKRGAAGARPQFNAVIEMGTLNFPNADGRIQTNYARNPAGEIVTWNGVRQESDSGRDIYRRGATRRYTGSASGGLEQLKYFVSGSYESSYGVEPNNELQQFGFTANLNTALRSHTDVGTSLRYISNAIRLGADVGASPLLGAQVGHALLFPASRGFFPAPPEVAQELYDNTSNVNRFTGSVTVNNRPATWFSQRAIVGIDYSGEDARNLERFAEPDLAVFVGAAASGRIGQTLRQNYVATADYSGSARFDLTSSLRSTTSVGGQFYRTSANTSFLGGIGFPGPGLETVSATATPLASVQQELLNTTIGGFVEQGFAWNDRLFLSAGFRVDNNSAFGDDFKWVTYPKVSASWVINEEGFWADNRIVNSLRLRAAYGESGRQPQTYSALRTYAPVPGPGGTNAVTPGSIGNPDLKPERGREYEMGFETFLFNRLSVDFTYFTRRTEDVIVNQPVAPSAGFAGNQVQNLGEVDNAGYEVGASLRALSRDNFSWEIGLNMATNKDEITDLGGLPTVLASSGPYNLVGYPIGGIWSKRVVSADRDATTGGPTNILCDGGASAAPVTCAQAPLVYIGTPTPKFTGALQNTFTFGRNLRLYALFDWKQGHRIFNAVEFLRCTGQTGAPLCHENYYPNEYDPVRLAEARGAAIAAQTWSQYMQSANFIKLREVSLNYTLPQRWTKGRASITLAGRELATWTDYRGIDPEANRQNAATTAFQDDQAVTPNLQRFIATFNITW